MTESALIRAIHIGREFPNFSAKSLASHVWHFEFEKNDGDLVLYLHKLLVTRLCSCLDYIVEWLQMSDVGTLDSAMCGSSCRQEYLDWLKNCPHHFALPCQARMEHLDWLDSKHVLLSKVKISITEDQNFSKLGDLLCHHSLSLQELEIMMSENTWGEPQIEGYFGNLLENFRLCLKCDYQNLTTLNLVGCGYVGDETCHHICELAKAFPGVTCLNVLKVSLSTITMTEVSCNFCMLRRITAVMDHLGLVAVATNCIVLEQLDLSVSDIVVDTTHISCIAMCLQGLVSPMSMWTQQTVVTVARRCSSLRVLHLGHTTALNDDTLIALAAGCPELKKLSFNCSMVPVQGLCEVAQRCAQLSHLLLSHCSGLEEEHYMDLATRCARLEVLELRSAECFTDIALQCLAQVSPLLRLFLVEDAYALTHVSVKALFANCTQLEHLWCNGSGLLWTVMQSQPVDCHRGDDWLRSQDCEEEEEVARDDGHLSGPVLHALAWQDCTMNLMLEEDFSYCNGPWWA